jgi:hypothetical protein
VDGSEVVRPSLTAVWDDRPNSPAVSWLVGGSAPEEAGFEDRLERLEKELMDARRQLAELEGRFADGSLMRFEGVHWRGVAYQRGAVVVHGGTLWFCCRSIARAGRVPAWARNYSRV